jgi:hypothetical protein
MSRQAIQRLFASGLVKAPQNGETEDEIFSALQDHAVKAWKEAGADPSRRPDPELGRQLAKRIHGMGGGR